jgi:membrane protease YdiL (CAAX protease family)
MWPSSGRDAGGRRLLAWLLVAAVAFLLPREAWGGPLDTLVGTVVGTTVGLVLFLSLTSIPRRRVVEPSVNVPNRPIRAPIAGSILEELAWRGVVLQLLRTHISLPVAIVTTTAGFAILHFDSQHWRGVAVHAVTGFSFACVALVTGTVISSIVAHVVYNVLIGHHRNRIASGAPH